MHKFIHMHARTESFICMHALIHSHDPPRSLPRCMHLAFSDIDECLWGLPSHLVEERVQKPEGLPTLLIRQIVKTGHDACRRMHKYDLHIHTHACIFIRTIHTFMIIHMYNLHKHYYYYHVASTHT